MKEGRKEAHSLPVVLLPEMEYFGFSNALATPIGTVVKEATDSLLIGPDWQRNMEICDMVSSAPGNEGPEQALQAMSKRLQETDNKIVNLTLTIVETCMKNCGTHFASKVDRPFMTEITNISRGMRGVENKETALRLIQSWGREFERSKSTLPIFWDTYISLKAKGVNFPPEDPHTMHQDERGFEDNIVGSSGSIYRDAVPSKPSSSSTSSVERRKHTSEVDEIRKLNCDLDVVVEKIKLCREMMIESPGISEDEALADVIGFLESCRDRMSELIEAGAHGLLSEELLMKALQVNDAIQRTLEAEMNHTTIGPEDLQGLLANFDDAAKDSSGSTNSTTDLLDLDVGDASKAVVSSSSQYSSSTNAAGNGNGNGFAKAISDDMEDEFSNLSLKTVKKKELSKTKSPPIAKLPPPPGNNSKLKLSPPPPPPSSSSTAGVGNDILDLDLSYSSSQQPPAPPLPSGGVAPASSVTKTSSSIQPPATKEMTDDDLDSFLNSFPEK